jgi:hypothetical protein
MSAALMAGAGPAQAQNEDFGVLVMAHGDGTEWSHWVRRQAQELRAGNFREPGAVEAGKAHEHSD